MPRLIKYGCVVVLLVICYSLGGRRNGAPDFLAAAAAQVQNKPDTNPNHPSGAFHPESATPKLATEPFTLYRVRDYHYSGGNIGCPKCKDMYSALVTPPTPGAVIVAIRWIRRRPPTNNHWYRCQFEVECGRPEFSDPNDARQGCINKTSCYVNRATDDGVPGYEDDIEIDYQ